VAKFGKTIFLKKKFDKKLMVHLANPLQIFVESPISLLSFYTVTFSLKLKMAKIEKNKKLKNRGLIQNLFINSNL
jgi:hypothetical protein